MVARGETAAEESALRVVRALMLDGAWPAEAEHERERARELAASAGLEAPPPVTPLGSQALGCSDVAPPG